MIIRLCGSEAGDYKFVINLNEYYTPELFLQ